MQFADYGSYMPGSDDGAEGGDDMMGGMGGDFADFDSYMPGGDGDSGFDSYYGDFYGGN